MGNAWISLPLGKLKMTQIHNTGWRFPKSFWTQMRSSILDCLYRLHHHPHQRVHVIFLPALTGDLLEKWKNGKGCWEKWDGEQCNRRGVEDTGVREEQAPMSALSLCILPRWTEALWCHQASPLKWNRPITRSVPLIMDIQRGFGMRKEMEFKNLFLKTHLLHSTHCHRQTGRKGTCSWGRRPTRGPVQRCCGQSAGYYHSWCSEAK